MTVIESFKPLGLLAAVILAIGLWLVVRAWPQGGTSRTFSQHVATSKESIMYYILLFSIALPLLLLFFIDWFIPTFHMPQLATTLLILAAVTQFLCTLIPETGGVKSYIHRILASLSAISLLPVVAIIVANSGDTTAETISAICFVSMVGVVAVGAVRALSTKKIEHDYVLIFQSSYYLAFFVAVLSATYF